MTTGNESGGGDGVMIAVLSLCGLLFVATVVLTVMAIVQRSDEIEQTVSNWTMPEVVPPTPEPLPSATHPIVKTPAPPASSVPVPAPAARRSSNASEWITADDYPPAAIRLEQEGRVSIRLDMAAAGGPPLRCVVTTSSGKPLLDNAACEALMRRATFAPRDAPFSFSRSVQWRLPE